MISVDEQTFYSYFTFFVLKKEKRKRFFFQLSFILSCVGLFCHVSCVGVIFGVLRFFTIEKPPVPVIKTNSKIRWFSWKSRQKTNDFLEGYLIGFWFFESHGYVLSLVIWKFEDHRYKLKEWTDNWAGVWCQFWFPPNSNTNPTPITFHLHLGGFVLIFAKICWTNDLHGNLPSLGSNYPYQWPCVLIGNKIIGKSYLVPRIMLTLL